MWNADMFGEKRSRCTWYTTKGRNECFIMQRTAFMTVQSDGKWHTLTRARGYVEVGYDATT